MENLTYSNYMGRLSMDIEEGKRNFIINRGDGNTKGSICFRAYEEKDIELVSKNLKTGKMDSIVTYLGEHYIGRFDTQKEAIGAVYKAIEVENKKEVKI